MARLLPLWGSLAVASIAVAFPFTRRTHCGRRSTVALLGAECFNLHDGVNCPVLFADGDVMRLPGGRVAVLHGRFTGGIHGRWPGPTLLIGCDLRPAQFSSIDLRDVGYDRHTRWPDGFNPQQAG